MAKRKPLRLSFNEDTISIRFDAKGWNPVYTKMLEHYAKFFADGSIKGLNPAELIGNALALEALNRDGQESFRSWMEMLETDVRVEREAQNNPKEP